MRFLNNWHHASRLPVYANMLADTLREGDLVIWCGKKIDDYAIRCCTDSDFNHIAIVIERKDELELLEATADGVCTLPLEFYVEAWYWTHFSNLFHKVVIRELYTRGHGRGMTLEQCASLKKFAAETIGTSYQNNPLEYVMSALHRARLLEHKEDFSSMFCSELVAGAYKRLCLLPAERPANTYFPGDFTERHRRRLKLMDGACLGKEREIIFQRAPDASVIRATAPVFVRKLRTLRRNPLRSDANTKPTATSTSPPLERWHREVLARAHARCVLRKWLRQVVRRRRVTGPSSQHASLPSPGASGTSYA